MPTALASLAVDVVQNWVNVPAKVAKRTWSEDDKKILSVLLVLRPLHLDVQRTVLKMVKHEWQQQRHYTDGFYYTDEDLWHATYEERYGFFRTIPHPEHGPLFERNVFGRLGRLPLV